MLKNEYTHEITLDLAVTLKSLFLNLLTMHRAIFLMQLFSLMLKESGIIRLIKKVMLLR